MGAGWSKPTDLVQGILNLLMLKTIALEPRLTEGPLSSSAAPGRTGQKHSSFEFPHRALVLHAGVDTIEAPDATNGTRA